MDARGGLASTPLTREDGGVSEASAKAQLQALVRGYARSACPPNCRYGVGGDSPGSHVRMAPRSSAVLIGLGT